MVAGVAALILSANPNLTGAKATAILKDTADDIGPFGWDTSYGAGRVNAYRAIQAATGAPAADTTPPTALIVRRRRHYFDGIVVVNVSAADNVAVTKVDLYVDGSLAGSSASTPATFSWDTASLPNGSHSLQARAYDAAGEA